MLALGVLEVCCGALLAAAWTSCCCVPAVGTALKYDWSTPESARNCVDGLIAGLDEAVSPNEVVGPIAEVKHFDILDGIHFTGRVGDRHASLGDREGVVLHGPIEEQIVLADPVNVSLPWPPMRYPGHPSTEDIVAGMTHENVIASSTIELIVTITTRQVVSFHDRL